MTLRTLLATLALCLLAACATRQQVTVGKAAADAPLSSVALVAHGGKSEDMDVHIQDRLLAQGLDVLAPLPPATRRRAGVDLIVAYDDVWRWDAVMYLERLTIRFYEGSTGKLLATGQWQNSALHGLQDAGDVTRGLMDEMFASLPAAR